MRVHRPQPLRNRATVSVVIPCYKYGHFLPDAVASALDQPGLDLQVIVVDDCSPDGSADVARAMAADDPRVEVLVHETNKGHIATYNDGLARVTGDYVVLLSADDVLMPGALVRSVALMEAHPDVVLTYGYAVDFSDEVPEPSRARQWWTTWSGEEWARLVCGRGRNLLVNPEVIVRADVMREIGGYDPAHPHAGDLEVWLRAACRGRVARVNGPVQAAYRVHGSNMHTSTFGDLLTDLRAVRAVFDDVFSAQGDGGRMTRWATLRDRASRAIAGQAVAAAGREGLAADDRRSLLDFASDSWPDVTRSARWRLLGPDGVLADNPGRQVVERVERVRWAVRWRRWRALGT
jgi:GT2 family glycosyltransferase